MNIWSTRGGGDGGVPITSSSSSATESKLEQEDTADKDHSTTNTTQSTVGTGGVAVGGGGVTFDNLGLSHLLVERIKNQIGLLKPTPVQCACIPVLLQVPSRSLIAQAPTGTGKTLAFGVPMIQRWGKDPYGVFGLILTPTRELGIQIKDQLLFLGGERAKVALIIGGVDFQAQALELYSKPSFVVATPGRLLDHLQSAESSFKAAFRHCCYLIYDEGDKLLNEQFEGVLSLLEGALPQRKQVAFFSATMLDSDKKAALVQRIQRLSQSQAEPFIYDYQAEGQEQQDGGGAGGEETKELETRPEPLLSKIPLTQKYILCPRDFKDGYLMELLRSIRDQEIKLPIKVRSIIIFAATIRETQVLSLLLSNLGFSNVTLHSHLDQKGRAKALSDFRSSTVNTLVATDVVSRGLDIRGVDLVINYSIPMPPDYVHRVGRTGRGGSPGLAIMFVIPTRDIPFLNNVEKFIGEKLTEMKIDEKKVLKILTDVQANRKIADMTVEENDPFEERAKINKQKREILEAEEATTPLQEEEDDDEKPIKNIIKKKRPNGVVENPTSPTPPASSRQTKLRKLRK